MNQIQRVEELFDMFASEYETRYMDVSLYHNNLDTFCSSMENKSGHVLDVACGPGNLSKYVQSKLPGANLLCVDIAGQMIQLAKKNVPKARFLRMDCRQIGGLNEKFDGIICSFVMPYLSKKESEALIEDAADLLHPNGLIYLSTMEVDIAFSEIKSSSSGMGPKVEMFYHQSDHLVNALHTHGFDLIDFERKSNMNEPEESSLDLVIVARKTDN